jgi:hypothetical protein
MQDITALSAHGFFQTRCRLPMSPGQMNDKSLAQVGHLTGAQANVARAQLLDNFFGAEVVLEQRLADKDHHIVAEGRACGDQAAQKDALEIAAARQSCARPRLRQAGPLGR